MRKFMLSSEVQSEIERGFDLTREAKELLRLVVAEWESDPMSVQCFDLRVVARAKACVKSLNALPECAGGFL